MIHVFKTSVATVVEVHQLKSRLDSVTNDIIWNFDLEDCDKILRVDCPSVIPEDIIELLILNGFECIELQE